jgi:hypothetical protein
MQPSFDGQYKTANVQLRSIYLEVAYLYGVQNAVIQGFGATTMTCDPNCVNCRQL